MQPLTLCACEVDAEPVFDFAAGAGVGDVNLVVWRWGTERPARVVLIDDEGRLSGGPAH